jgi:hypothetical protein
MLQVTVKSTCWPAKTASSSVDDPSTPIAKLFETPTATPLTCALAAEGYGTSLLASAAVENSNPRVATHGPPNFNND